MAASTPRDGEARVQGWTEGSGVDVQPNSPWRWKPAAYGASSIPHISRDGTMQGPDVQAYRTLGQQLATCKITASGGVGEHQDLLKIQSLRSYGVDSVIVGKALYENAFPCQQFWCWNDEELVDLDTFSTAPLRDTSMVDNC
ncbi:MAG: HisA/HisF-related TIM barrel protein [Gammaproteobacteria bacterium]|nr:HisA/HisF-related TIM barrel protein [Gammaproteobacteria bacterium]